MDRTTAAEHHGPGTPRPVHDDARPTGDGGGPPRRSLLVVALIALAVVASGITGPWSPPFREDVGELEPAELPQLAPPTFEPFPEFDMEALDVPQWDLRWVGAVLLALVALAVLAVVVRWWRRRERPRPPDGPPDPSDVESDLAVGAHPGALPDLPTLRDGVDDAGERLRRTTAPGDAVVAAWVALEAAAERTGILRDRASTPTEFTVTVLDRTDVDPQATRTLLDLYLQARFGRTALTDEDVAAASTALQTLADGLDDPPRPPAP
ncbi:hypothetical protein N869_00540, partial [Cellulomonas bogoriensis 69B4 = DSM 16987]